MYCDRAWNVRWQGEHHLKLGALRPYDLPSRSRVAQLRAQPTPDVRVREALVREVPGLSMVIRDSSW